MAVCPRWAKNHADRVFDLVEMNGEHIVQSMIRHCPNGTSTRNFKRACLALPDSRIIQRKRDLLIGWRRTQILEDEREGSDATISLVSFTPSQGPFGVVLQYKIMGLFIHKHALARLFERALQAPEAVASSLLQPHFVNSFPALEAESANPGFATPFKDGKFVGSVEWVRDSQGTMTLVFGIRSWLPDAISTFTWTKSENRSLRKAMEINRRNYVLSMLAGEMPARHAGPDYLYV